jgi:hypothetical protein
MLLQNFSSKFVDSVALLQTGKQYQNITEEARVAVEIMHKVGVL